MAQQFMAEQHEQIAGQQAQAQASALLCRLDTLSSTLRRFVRGDVMTAPERATLQSLGISLADAVETLTQAHPDPDCVAQRAGLCTNRRHSTRGFEQ